MRIETLGSPSAPAILAIPGMLCTSESVKFFARHMADDFYWILPTLSGHYAGAPDYISKEAEAAGLLSWLREHGVTRLALLHGTSMGAEVALEVFRQAGPEVTIDRCFFDGGPFFHFPGWFRRIMEKKFHTMARIVQYDDPEEALDALAQIPLFRRILGSQREKYLPIIRTMTTEKRTISAATLRNVTQTCYACALPAFSEEVQRRFFFLFSDDEPAHMAKRRLMKAYPHASFQDVHALGHCGLQMSDPQGYAAMLRDYIGRA